MGLISLKQPSLPGILFFQQFFQFSSKLKVLQTPSGSNQQFIQGFAYKPLNNYFRVQEFHQDTANNANRTNTQIGLTFDLIRKIIKNPDMADKIPDNAIIEFVEKDFEVRKKSYAKNSKLINVKNEIEII